MRKNERRTREKAERIEVYGKINIKFWEWGERERKLHERKKKKKEE